MQSPMLICAVLMSLFNLPVLGWFVNDQHSPSLKSGRSSNRATISKDGTDSDESLLEVKLKNGKKKKRIMRSEKVAREMRERQAAQESVEMDSEGDVLSDAQPPVKDHADSFAEMIKEAVALGISDDQLEAHLEQVKEDKMVLANWIASKKVLLQARTRVDDMAPATCATFTCKGFYKLKPGAECKATGCDQATCCEDYWNDGVCKNYNQQWQPYSTSNKGSRSATACPDSYTPFEWEYCLNPTQYASGGDWPYHGKCNNGNDLDNPDVLRKVTLCCKSSTGNYKGLGPITGPTTGPAHERITPFARLTRCLGGSSKMPYTNGGQVCNPDMEPCTTAHLAKYQPGQILAPRGSDWATGLTNTPLPSCPKPTACTSLSITKCSETPRCEISGGSCRKACMSWQYTIPGNDMPSDLYCPDYCFRHWSPDPAVNQYLPCQKKCETYTNGECPDHCDSTGGACHQKCDSYTTESCPTDVIRSRPTDKCSLAPGSAAPAAQGPAGPACAAEVYADNQGTYEGAGKGYAVYQWDKKNTNECPNGRVKIESAAECQAAKSKMGRRRAPGAVAGLFSNFKGPWYPYGCNVMHNYFLFFNANKANGKHSATAPVCVCNVPTTTTTTTMSGCTKLCDAYDIGSCPSTCEMSASGCGAPCASFAADSCPDHCDSSQAGSCRKTCEAYGDGACPAHCDSFEGVCVSACESYSGDSCPARCDSSQEGSCQKTCESYAIGECPAHCDSSGESCQAVVKMKSTEVEGKKYVEKWVKLDKYLPGVAGFQNGAAASCAPGQKIETLEECSKVMDHMSPQEDPYGNFPPITWTGGLYARNDWPQGCGIWGNRYVAWNPHPNPSANNVKVGLVCTNPDYVPPATCKGFACAGMTELRGNYRVEYDASKNETEAYLGRGDDVECDGPEKSDCTQDKCCRSVWNDVICPNKEGPSMFMAAAKDNCPDEWYPFQWEYCPPANRTFWLPYGMKCAGGKQPTTPITLCCRYNELHTGALVNDPKLEGDMTLLRVQRCVYFAAKPQGSIDNNVMCNPNLDPCEGVYGQTGRYYLPSKCTKSDCTTGDGQGWDLPFCPAPKPCPDFTVDECPPKRCKVEGGACTKVLLDLVPTTHDKGQVSKLEEEEVDEELDTSSVQSSQRYAPWIPALMGAAKNGFVTTTPAPPVASSSSSTWFCVVGGSDVFGPFSTVQAAKSKLSDVNGGSRMVCEMTSSGAKSDPHFVGGESQHSPNFNKWWSGWSDIYSMNDKCEADTDCSNGP